MNLDLNIHLSSICTEELAFFGENCPALTSPKANQAAVCHCEMTCAMWLSLHFLSELPTKHLQIEVTSFKTCIVRKSLGLGRKEERVRD